MASSEWWNIWTLASPQAEVIIPHTIQAATEPQKGDKSQWGEIWTVAGPYKTKDDALQAIGQYHGPPPGSTGFQDKPPVGLGGLASIGAFFDKLSEANTWIRVGEVLLGLALIIVGTAKLFANTSVGKAATKAGKVAALL